MTPFFRLLCFAAATAFPLPWPVLAEAESAALFQPANIAPQELALGELMPDVLLRGCRGEEVRLADFRGKAVAVTFFYSRCTAATFCPLVGRNFAAAQSLLKQMGAAGNCHLLSISLDPARDTSEVLAAYARGYEADPALWTFAAGNEADIQKLGAAVGLEYKRVDDLIDHNLRTVVLDASGHVRRIFRGDGWTPQELAAELNATARRFR
ncbi:MAG: SCO family protein [Chthoniobacter sp.]